MGRGKSVIEFGTSKIACLTDLNERFSQSVIAGHSCARYEGIKDGTWVNKRGVFEALEAAVTNCEQQSGKQISKAVIGVPGCFCHQVMSKTVRNFPSIRLAREDVEDMLKEGRPKEISSEGYTLIDERPIYFDDCAGTETLDPPIGHKVRRLYMFSSYIYIRNSYLRFIEELLDKLSITAESYVMDQYALGLHCIPQSVRDNTAILIDVGYNETSVSCIIGSAVAVTRHFPAGGSYITSSLEKKLGVSAMLAENIKRTYIFGISPSSGGKLFAKDEFGRMHSLNQFKVDGIMNTQADKLIMHIEQIIREFTAKRFCEQGSPVYITGAGFLIKGMESYISQKLGKKVFFVKEYEKMRLSPIYSTSLALLDNRLNWGYDFNVDEDKTASPDKKGIFKLFR